MSKYENLPKGFVEQSEFAGYESVAFASVKNMVEKASGSGSETNKKQDDEIKAIKEDLEANYVKKGDIEGDGIVTSDILDEKLQGYAQKTAVTAVEDAVAGKVSSDDFNAKTEALEAADREINERLNALTDTDDSTLEVIRQINEALSANTSDDANTKEVLEAAIAKKVDKDAYDAKVEELQSGITKNAEDIAAIDLTSYATVSALENAAGELNGKIDENTNSISGLNETVSELPSREFVENLASLLDEKISANTEAINAIDLAPYAKTDDVNAKVEELQSGITKNTEAIDEIDLEPYAKTVDVNAKVEELQSGITENQNAINEIDLEPYAKTDDVNAMAEELQSGITENKNAIANLATQASVDAKVDRIEYEQMVGELQSGITDNENAINVNANAIAELPTQADVNAKVDKDGYGQI